MTIEAYVSELFGIDQNWLYTEMQRREVVYARDVCMYFRVKIYKSFYDGKGQTFSTAAQTYNRDHATAHFAVKKVGNFIDVYPKWADMISEIIELYQNGKIIFEKDITPEERIIMDLQ